MIDYSELDKFYTGISAPVSTNFGGALLELGNDINTILYKLDDEYYIDINNQTIAQVLRKGSSIASPFVVQENSLRQVQSEKEIIDNTSLAIRLRFKPSDYIQNNLYCIYHLANNSNNS